MPPEIYNKQPFNGHTVDLWAVGVILLIMLTGRRPWDKPHLLDTAFRHITQGHLTTILRNSWNIVGLSEDAIDLLQRMLVLDPVDRLTFEQVRSHPWICTMGPEETLGCLYDHLKSYTVKESLDEDELIQMHICKDGNKLPVRRQTRGRMRMMMEEQITKVQDDCWNDNDLFDREEDQKMPTKNCAGKSIVDNNTIVSNTFFDSIISEATGESQDTGNVNNSGSNKKKRDHEMNDFDALTIKTLRNICIQDKTKGQLNKEDVLQSAGEDTILYECENDESNGPVQRRLTRGMIRDTQKKKNQEEWESREMSCFDALIAAMIEIEEGKRKKPSREKKDKSGNERTSAKKKSQLSSTCKKRQIKETIISTSKKRQGKATVNNDVAEPMTSIKKRQSKETIISTSKKRLTKEATKVKTTVNNDVAEPMTRKKSRTEEHIPISNVQLIAEVPAGRKGNGKRSSRRNIQNSTTKTIRVTLAIGNEKPDVADVIISPVIPIPGKSAGAVPVISTTEIGLSHKVVRWIISLKFLRHLW